jgi:hypothetical protein
MCHLVCVSSSMCVSLVPVQCPCPRRAAYLCMAFRKIFTEMWGFSLYGSCKDALIPPGSKSCTSCSSFVRMHIKDLDCVIYQEPAEQVRKLCGTCRKVICMSCWLGYIKTARVPTTGDSTISEARDEVSESDED